MKFEIFCGSVKTMESYAKRGVAGLNPKTMRWQIVDKTALYEVVQDSNGAVLTSNKNLREIAKEKHLIL